MEEANPKYERTGLLKGLSESETRPIYQLYKFDNISKMDHIAYGIGHVFNDLVAACWFNYLVYYLKNVLKIKSASYALLAG